VNDDTVTVARLIELVKNRDLDGLSAALAAGAPVSERDDNDWCSLDWAAGEGDPATIQLLLDHGADPSATGRELRTPYQIALAAARVDAARLLREAEETADPSSADRHVWRPYCKAYQVSDLRRFAGWSEAPAGDPLDGDSVVFVHDDLTVTRSMWPGEEVVFDAVTDEWAMFCTDHLAFRVPDDFDLVPPHGNAPTP
jgi:Ankyrin repeats (many copies)